MVRIDENQEAIAYIRMAVDNDKKSRASQANSDEEDHTESSKEMELLTVKPHWTFGSPSTRSDSRELEKILAPTNRNFVSFDERLRYFITSNFPEEGPCYKDLIHVCSFHSEEISFPYFNLILIGSNFQMS